MPCADVPDSDLKMEGITMNKAILVTGGAGFIGSHATRAILTNPDLGHYRLIVLDDLSGGFRENVPRDPRVEFVLGSITDRKLVDTLFQRHRFAYVYHIAAYAAEGLSHFIRRFNYSNNLLGSVNLINAAVNYGTDCFVFTSSIAVYGAGQVPMREDMVPQPEDPYGISKYAVEMDLKAAHNFFGLNYVIFRPHNVYGEYQNIGDRYRNVVGIFMNQILQDKSMTIFGDGAQQRAFTYIGDIAPIIASSPIVNKCRNQVFNVGADQPYSVNYLALEVAKAMGVNPRIAHLSPRSEVALAYSDHSAVRAVFGKTKQTSLEEGLCGMAQWVKAVGSRKSKDFGDIEISRNLPPSWAGTASDEATLPATSAA
jgi:UDP-glucose 4-epimerase